MSEEQVDLTKKRLLSEVPFLNRILSRLPGAARLDLLIKQANLNILWDFFFSPASALH